MRIPTLLRRVPAFFPGLWILPAGMLAAAPVTAPPVPLPPLLSADGTIFYGAQRSRPAWNARFAELWEIDSTGGRIERLDALAAIYGPVPLELVEEYLAALRDAGLLLPPA